MQFTQAQTVRHSKAKTGADVRFALHVQASIQSKIVETATYGDASACHLSFGIEDDKDIETMTNATTALIKAGYIVTGHLSTNDTFELDIAWT